MCDVGCIYRNARKKCEYFNSANCARCFPLALFWCALIRLLHMRVCLALAVVAQIRIAHYRYANEQFCSNHAILFSHFFLALRYLVCDVCCVCVTHAGWGGAGDGWRWRRAPCCWGGGEG